MFAINSLMFNSDSTLATRSKLRIASHHILISEFWDLNVGAITHQKKYNITFLSPSILILAIIHSPLTSSIHLLRNLQLRWASTAIFSARYLAKFAFLWTLAPSLSSILASFVSLIATILLSLLSHSQRHITRLLRSGLAGYSIRYLSAYYMPFQWF